MSDAAAPAAAFRVILQTDSEDGPAETTLPFVPFVGIHLRNPADGLYAKVRLVGWDADEGAFFVDFEE